MFFNQSKTNSTILFASSPVRGNYDGLVVLAAITRETLPNYANTMVQTRKKSESFLDHEHFVLTLEAALTASFMYAGDPDLQLKCVPTNRAAVSLGEAIDDGRAKQKKFVAYAIYVAYRLDPAQAYAHQAKISRQVSVSNAVGTGVPVDPMLQGSEASDLTASEMQQRGTLVGTNSIILEENGEDGESRRSRSSSSSLKRGNGGTGAYDIEDIDDFEYGKGAGSGAQEEGIIGNVLNSWLQDDCRSGSTL